MNKKTKHTAIFVVVIFSVIIIAAHFSRYSEVKNYKPTHREEFTSYAEWKNKCIENNLRLFALNAYWHDVIWCSGSSDTNNTELSFVLKGDEIFNFNYENFPELNNQITVNTKTQVDKNNLIIPKDWQLYRNPDFGFELKFPNSFRHSWYLAEPDSGASKYVIGSFSLRNVNGNSCGITIDVYDGKVYSILKMPPLGVALTTEKINLGDQMVSQYSYYIEKPPIMPGTSVQPGPKVAATLVLIKDGKVYELRGVADKGEPMESLMKEIISTFGFTSRSF